MAYIRTVDGEVHIVEESIEDVNTNLNADGLFTIRLHHQVKVYGRDEFDMSTMEVKWEPTFFVKSNIISIS